jgi:DNA (cytosine-5)-methyltransferase 1
MTTKTKNLNFIDLFSGCGGFSTGMELSGHRCLLGVDFDKDAINTFKLNHKSAEAFCGDIKTLNKTKLDELLKSQTVDMVIGGPPCQGFSTIGKGEAGDDRNSLFKEFVRIVKHTNPKIVIFENVTGILASKNKNTLAQIFKCFEDLGYKMDARVLSSEEYGVPETRRRTIIIGSKNCSAPIFPQITHGDRGGMSLNTVGNAFKDLKSEDGRIYNHDIELAQLSKKIDFDRLKCIPEGKYVRYKKDEEKYLPKNLRFGVNWEELGEGRFRQARLQRLDRKLPSPTILTSRTSYYHPVENRYLTPREAAACQSFPNEFVFTGSTTSQFRQIGNAVPPLMAMAIGEVVKKMISSRRKVVEQNKEIDFSKYAFRYDAKPAA